MLRIQVLLTLLKHLARVLSPMRAARKLLDQRRRQLMIKGLVVAQAVADRRLKRREIKHDGAFAPVRAVGRVVRDLAQQIEVRFSELDVDAAAVSRGHDLALQQLVVEGFADALEDGVGLRDGEREFEREAAQPEVPFCAVARVEATD